MADVKPFVIWTLQRTGGTTLANALFQRFPFREGLHEPFNEDRKFRHIREYWLANRNFAALTAAIDEICQNGTLIKHCIEVVPPEISSVLIDASVRANYRHLFLYRKNAAARLLSLHFARQTGIWGPILTQKEAVGNTGVSQIQEANEANLPVEDLVRHEQACVHALSEAWRRLVEARAFPIALAYEDIYLGNNPHQARALLLPVVKALGGSHGQKDDLAFIDRTVRVGDQGTRDKYRSLRRAEELAVNLRNVSAFQPSVAAKRLVVTRVLKDHAFVVHAAVDVTPSEVREGIPFAIEGIVVLSKMAPSGCSLRIRADGCDWEARWDIKSDRIFECFPEGRNGRHARFRVEGLAFPSGGPLSIVLVSRELDPLTLFQVGLADRADLGPEREPMAQFDAQFTQDGFRWDAAMMNRMNQRARRIFPAGADLVRNKSVLDLGARDGRWSWAAHQNGAKSTLGIEGRAASMKHGASLMQRYVDAQTHRTIIGDVFNVMASLVSLGFRFDVVLCLGFLYHTYDHWGLMRLMASLEAATIVIDGEMDDSDSPAVRVRRENTDHPNNAVDARRPFVVVGNPTRGAVDLMGRCLGYDVRWMDWGDLDNKLGCKDYVERTRFTCILTRAT